MFNIVYTQHLQARGEQFWPWEWGQDTGDKHIGPDKDTICSADEQLRENKKGARYLRDNIHLMLNELGPENGLCQTLYIQEHRTRILTLTLTHMLYIQEQADACSDPADTADTSWGIDKLVPVCEGEG